MSKRLITLMAALLVLGFVVAGCGDDESSGDSGDTAAQTVTDTDVVTDDEVVTDTETETVTDDTDTDADNGGAVVPENVEQAVTSCKKAVTAYPQLSADTKSDLEDLCDKAASGNAEDAQEAGIEVCQKIIEDMYPSGVPGKDQALSACESSIK
jgi:hypothetical protein